MAEAESDSSLTAKLSGTEKSAILMMLLGEEQAAEIFQNLSPREVQHLGTAMYAVSGVDQEAVNAVLDEFLTLMKQQTSLGLGAGNYIQNVLKRALGDDKAQSVLSRITPADSNRPIEILDWMEARSIAELIMDEHPQIVALVVSYLEYGMASDVLNLLSEDMQAEVILRIATLETVDPNALKELEQVMISKFKANTNLRSSQVGGVAAASKIMNFTKETMEKRILGVIKKHDKDLMTAIQDNMFTFDNLIMSDERSLQTLLRATDPEDLIMALKGSDQNLQEKLFGCMSTRAAANLRDEMETLGPVRLTEVQDAQKNIIAVARKMSDDGTIVLAGRGGEEMVLMAKSKLVGEFDLGGSPLSAFNVSKAMAKAREAAFILKPGEAKDGGESFRKVSWNEVAPPVDLTPDPVIEELTASSAKDDTVAQAIANDSGDPDGWDEALQSVDTTDGGASPASPPDNQAANVSAASDDVTDPLNDPGGTTVMVEGLETAEHGAADPVQAAPLNLAPAAPPVIDETQKQKIREEAYDEGFSAGKAMTESEREAELAERIADLDRLVGALSDPELLDIDLLSAQIRQSVLSLGNRTCRKSDR